MGNEYDPHYVPPRDYYLLGVKTIIVDPHDRLLLLRRSRLTSYAGCWDLPGGAVGQSEDPITAAGREAREETGLFLPTNSFQVVDFVLARKDDSDLLVVGFTARSSDDRVNLSWEHDDFLWVSFDQIHQYSLSPVVTRLIQASNVVCHA
ncbi:MAG TPA: NUDIX domain-containing protein [bacterium]|nr:NUDIX domain-containing protein [bacterium]